MPRRDLNLDRSPAMKGPVDLRRPHRLHLLKPCNSEGSPPDVFRFDQMSCRITPDEARSCRTPLPTTLRCFTTAGRSIKIQSTPHTAPCLRTQRSRCHRRLSAQTRSRFRIIPREPKGPRVIPSSHVSPLPEHRKIRLQLRPSRWPVPTRLSAARLLRERRRLDLPPSAYSWTPRRAECRETTTRSPSGSRCRSTIFLCPTKGIRMVTAVRANSRTSSRKLARGSSRTSLGSLAVLQHLKLCCPQRSPLPVPRLRQRRLPWR